MPIISFSKFILLTGSNFHLADPTPAKSSKPTSKTVKIDSLPALSTAAEEPASTTSVPILTIFVKDSPTVPPPTATTSLASNTSNETHASGGDGDAITQSEDPSLVMMKASIFCQFIAEDFMDSAWDICHERHCSKTSSQAVTYDLRNTWLAIVDMNFMDTDDLIKEQTQLVLPEHDDSIPLPPKFDSWSHGAMQEMPRACRESVMDPFLRDPLQWLVEKYAADHKKDGGSTEDSLTSLPSRLDQVATAEQLVRPSNAVPHSTTSEEEEEYEEDDDKNTDGWSQVSTAGSFSNVSNLNEMSSSRLGSLIGAPISAATFKTAMNQDSERKGNRSTSIEFLYPSKIPVPVVINASSEIAYKSPGRGLPTFGRRTSKTVNGEETTGKRSSETVAFKLPHQTSSESRRDHRSRKSREKPVHKSASSHNF